MLAHEAASVAHRCQAKVDPVGLFDHLPSAATSVCPTFARPVIVGAYVLAGTPAPPPGAAPTAPVCLDSAAVDPSAFVAVTRTLIVCFSSAAASTYVFAVAEGIAAHFFPSFWQRSHTYENDVGALIQVPSLAVSVWPTFGVPEILGRSVFAGATATAADPVAAPIESTSSAAAARPGMMRPHEIRLFFE